jgi:hypothetical protein
MDKVQNPSTSVNKKLILLGYNSVYSVESSLMIRRKNSSPSTCNKLATSSSTPEMKMASQRKRQLIYKGIEDIEHKINSS